MKKIILEDVSYGIYDRPGPGPNDDTAENKDGLTVGKDVPLEPLEHMSNQLSVQRPPIEDEEFLPASTEELSRAASAISQLVPHSQIEFFYRSLHKLLDDSSGRDSNQDANTAEKPLVKVDTSLEQEKQEESPVKENYIKHKIRSALFEVLSDEDVDELDSYRGREYSTGDVDYFGEDPVPTDRTTVSTKSDGMVSLDDIAAEFGYAGASGVRQEIQRLTDRLQYFVTKVKKEDLDSLVEYAAGEYIDTMVAADLVDPEDAEFLRSNPAQTKSTSSFKFFFVTSFILPAYREVVRNSTRSLNQEIEQLGIPKGMHQTVFNQVTGASKRGTIAKKLAAIVKSGKMEKQEALGLVRKIEPALPALAAAADKSDDLVQKSLDRWQSMSKKKRQGVLSQALEQTGS